MILLVCVCEASSYIEDLCERYPADAAERHRVLLSAELHSCSAMNMFQFCLDLSFHSGCQLKFFLSKPEMSRLFAS